MSHANEQLSFENYSDFLDQYCRSSPLTHKVLPTIELTESPFNPCMTETQEFGEGSRSHFAELSENATSFKRRSCGYESMASDKSVSTANMPSKRHTPWPVVRDSNIPAKDSTRACTPADYRHIPLGYDPQADVSVDLNTSDNLSALYERRKEAAKT